MKQNSINKLSGYRLDLLGSEIPSEMPVVSMLVLILIQMA